MGNGGVVSMRRNDDYSSDYAFDVSDSIGHPHIADYTLDNRDYRDYGEVVHHDRDYGGGVIHHGVEREAFEHDYSSSYDFGHYDGGFEYDSGFDYY